MEAQIVPLVEIVSDYDSNSRSRCDFFNCFPGGGSDMIRWGSKSLMGRDGSRSPSCVSHVCQGYLRPAFRPATTTRSPSLGGAVKHVGTLSYLVCRGRNANYLSRESLS